MWTLFRQVLKNYIQNHANKLRYIEIILSRTNTHDLNMNYMNVSKLTIKRNKTTKQNEAKLNPILSTTMPPATGPNKELLDKKKQMKCLNSICIHKHN